MHLPEEAGSWEGIKKLFLSNPFKSFHTTWDPCRIRGTCGRVYYYKLIGTKGLRIKWKLKYLPSSYDSLKLFYGQLVISIVCCSYFYLIYNPPGLVAETNNILNILSGLINLLQLGHAYIPEYLSLSPGYYS